MTQKERSRRWYLANTEKHHGQARRWAAKYRRKRNRILLKSHLKHHYGITLEDYDKLVRRHNGKCAICKKSPKKRRLHVDHCHKTNRVRGLLCVSCNVFLGYLETHINKFPKIWRYLYEQRAI